MKIVLDTNIMLDLIAHREFFKSAEAVMNLVAEKKVEAVITANTMTDLSYLLKRHHDIGINGFQNAIVSLDKSLDIIKVDEAICKTAFTLNMSDYEDAVLAQSAKVWDADYIITRDQTGFVKSPVQALSPDQFLELMEKERNSPNRESKQITMADMKKELAEKRSQGRETTKSASAQERKPPKERT